MYFFLLQTTGNILDFCLVGLKISGVTPISAEAVVSYSDASVTAVAVTRPEVGGHTVAFLGTDDGRLKKVSFWVFTHLNKIGINTFFFCLLRRNFRKQEGL